MAVPDFDTEEGELSSVYPHPPNGEMGVGYASPLRRKCLLEFKLPALLENIRIKVTKRIRK